MAIFTNDNTEDIYISSIRFRGEIVDILVSIQNNKEIIARFGDQKHDCWRWPLNQIYMPFLANIRKELDNSKKTSMLHYHLY